MARMETLSSFLLPILMSWCEDVHGSSEVSPYYSLSGSQQRGLASIIDLTNDYDDESEGPESALYGHERCSLDRLVRDADAAFTAEASAAEREAMWSSDDGEAETLI